MYVATMYLVELCNLFAELVKIDTCLWLSLVCVCVCMRACVRVTPMFACPSDDSCR